MTLTNKEVQEMTLKIRAMKHAILGGKRINMSREMWDLCIMFDGLRESMNAHNFRPGILDDSPNAWEIDNGA